MFNYIAINVLLLVALIVLLRLFGSSIGKTLTNPFSLVVYLVAVFFVPFEYMWNVVFFYQGLVAHVLFVVYAMDYIEHFFNKGSSHVAKP